MENEQPKVMSYIEWLVSKWHGIPIWLIFTLALSYNLIGGISVFGILLPILMSIAWYSHYSYYAGGKSKKGQLSTGKVILIILGSIIFIFLFMIVVGSLFG